MIRGVFDKFGRLRVSLAGSEPEPLPLVYDRGFSYTQGDGRLRVTLSCATPAYHGSYRFENAAGATRGAVYAGDGGSPSIFVNGTGRSDAFGFLCIFLNGTVESYSNGLGFDAVGNLVCIAGDFGEEAERVAVSDVVGMRVE